jgi:hypothetical protein
VIKLSTIGSVTGLDATSRLRYLKRQDWYPNSSPSVYFLSKVDAGGMRGLSAACGTNSRDWSFGGASYTFGQCPLCEVDELKDLKVIMASLDKRFVRRRL